MRQGGVREGLLTSIDYERLLKLRLAIARLGEMDNAGWWNTKGLLGSSGSFVLRRGFPTTHPFAQARTVFAVATERCREVFAAPDCVTLWQLPASIEEQFDEQWQGWLDQTKDWQPTFDQIAALRGYDVLGALGALGLIAEQEKGAIIQLSSSAHDPSLRLDPGTGGRDLDDDHITLLAAAFAKSVQGKLTVPYIQLTPVTGR